MSWDELFDSIPGGIDCSRVASDFLHSTATCFFKLTAVVSNPLMQNFCFLGSVPTLNGRSETVFGPPAKTWFVACLFAWVDGHASLNQFKRARRPRIWPAAPSGPQDDGFDDCDDDHMSTHDGPPAHLWHPRTQVPSLSRTVTKIYPNNRTSLTLARRIWATLWPQLTTR